MSQIAIGCDYAQDFEEGEPCPHTGQVNCLDPLCPMIETGRAWIETVEDEEEE